MDGVTTYTVGGYFEWRVDASGSRVVKYYSAGSARVAMRKEEIVTYLFGDHLGSTSVTFDDVTNDSQSQGYTAFGEQRYFVSENSPPFSTDYQYTGQKDFEAIGLQFYNARWYDSALGRFTQADSIIPQPGNPMAWDRFAYTLNNPIIHIDPTGHSTGLTCKHLADGYCNGVKSTNSQGLLDARVYYLNAIGNADRGVIQPNSDPGDEQGYFLYRLGILVGPENVIHIPIYEGTLLATRLEMIGEMIEIRTWSPKVASRIFEDLQNRPLRPGEKLILIGNSGGGTVAIEALDLLEEYGIHVDQVILRGSPVQEAALTNVTRVDYITSKFDYYYSYDSNPNDSVVVQQHKVNFWGHTMPTSMVVVDVAELMMSLMVNGGEK